MTPLKVSLRDQQMALLVDLFEDAATIAYKLCPDLFASEKMSYADDVTGSLDKSYFPGVRSGSPGPPPHLLGIYFFKFPNMYYFIFELELAIVFFTDICKTCVKSF